MENLSLMQRRKAQRHSQRVMKIDWNRTVRDFVPSFIPDSSKQELAMDGDTGNYANYSS